MSSETNETRTRILEAAWALLEAGQGNAVRMSDIAKAAGISRQAVYLHFPKRAELLIATTRYIDTVKKVDERLAASRTAPSGLERLDAFIESWGNYIPEIYGVAKALIAMQDSDEAARMAWDDRLDALRQGFQAAVEALEADGHLTADLSLSEATDALWTLMSVQTWAALTQDCGWTQARYIEATKAMARNIVAR